MFGSAHIGNFIANQNILLSTLSQLVSGTLIGIFFAACVLRSKTIWPAIILHATVDFIGQIQQIVMGSGIETAKQAVASISLKQALEPIGLYLILASYAFFILKKVTPVDVQSKLFSNFLRK